ncbi:hypothetical protein [Thiocapsa bogorovii]|uniref:hypothetical protein n=1 Tax=Thiocapsa bogorovii TaxID=521689 RepID=UPI001E41C7D5|nr:hypothetical protein [Thiocapsa bogorovii]UHD18573.1 hypothetical protein LT988_11310 [Thiocapsa bogorovii]
MTTKQRPLLALVDRAPAPIPRDEHGCPRHVYIAENELWCSWGSDGDTFAEVAALPWDEAVSVFRQWWTARQEQTERQIDVYARRAKIREAKP